MLTQQGAADQFWAWFQQHSTLFTELPQNQEHFAHWMGELHGRLRTYSQQRLYAEIDWPYGTGACRLIISAGGDARHFAKVEQLVDRAPAMLGWQVVAFHPPQPDLNLFRHRFGDTGIDPYDLWFCPIDMKHTRINNKPILTVYAQVRNPVNDKFSKAVKAVVTGLLGERAAALELACIRVKGYKGARPCQGKQVFNLQMLPVLLPCLDQISLVVNEQGELESGFSLD